MNWSATSAMMLGQRMDAGAIYRPTVGSTSDTSEVLPSGIPKRKAKTGTGIPWIDECPIRDLVKSQLALLEQAYQSDKSEPQCTTDRYTKRQQDHNRAKFRNVKFAWS